LYLGDGMLSMARRHVWLRISLDAIYPQIIARGKSAIAEVGGPRVGATARPGCVEISSSWKHWICAFPQDGPGRKHERPIRLEGWQRSVVVAHPGDFVAGLIHSDGCRVLNRVKGRVYPRYFFSNFSADIRGLFVWACTLLGVESRADGPRNIAVSARPSVAILDRIVGPESRPIWRTAGPRNPATGHYAASGVGRWRRAMRRGCGLKSEQPRHPSRVIDAPGVFVLEARCDPRDEHRSSFGS